MLQYADVRPKGYPFPTVLKKSGNKTFLTRPLFSSSVTGKPAQKPDFGGFSPLWYPKSGSEASGLFYPSSER